MPGKKSVILAVIAVLILNSIALFTSCARPALDVVALDSGKVRGTQVEGVWTYLGIPYAAPPTGGLRWREPQPVKAWDGIRDCNKYGPVCPQPKSFMYDISNANEDCLYLNVWSPAKSSDESLPVMVWVHGGGFRDGAASLAMYEGNNLAKQGVIIVSFNYRLGPLGFLSHPLLSKESSHGVSGNYGLLDQVAALKWVKQNIRSFGGDPGNVTIFGESAGGTAVCDLMVCPLADGLFQRVISESGSFGDAYPAARDDTVAKAEITGSAMAARLGCDKVDDVLAAMRQKPADDLIKAAYSSDTAFYSVVFRPVIDGWVIPENPWSMFTAGKQKKVPLLIGTNANEGSIFVMPDPKVQKMTVEDYQAYINNTFGGNAAEALRLFPASSKEDVVPAMVKLRTVLGFAAGAMHAAETTAANGSKVYMYQFTRVPDSPLKMVGAFHGLEIFYLFGHFKADRVAISADKTDIALSQNMMKYWTNFARAGDPNGGDLPAWPVYTTASQQYLKLGDQLTVDAGLNKEYAGLITSIAGR